MNTISTRSDMTVTLETAMGSDESILKAMLASTAKSKEVDSYTTEQKQGKINFLMKNRHGSPFEHAAMTFYMEMPIFVFREFHRHRIGWSYNEMSGRYVELPPMFYVPDADRPLVQEGKPGSYTMVPGDKATYIAMAASMRNAYDFAYKEYEFMIRQGVAKEVARDVLPVGIYSQQYATCNPRSLMAFLSLRTEREPFVRDAIAGGHNDGALFPSRPLKEIQMVADDMERIFADEFPLTYRAFCDNGRVAP